MLALNYGFWTFWEEADGQNYYGAQQCTFDGPNKLIIVNSDVTNLDIKTDVYSGWKEWMQDPVHLNSKYLPAITSTGGEPIPGTSEFTGDVYFLINGWRLVIDITKVAVTGILYSATETTAYYDANLNALFPARVSSLVNTVGTGGGGSTPQEVWEYGSRTLTSASGPTAEQVADAVWEEAHNDHDTIGTMGHLMNDIKRLNQKIYVNTENVSNGEGSQDLPFNNITDAIDLAETTGVSTLVIIGDVILDRNVKNFYIEGIGVPEFDCNGFSVSDSHFTEVRFKGQYTGSVVVRDCVLVNDSWLNGFFENCALGGDLFCLPNSEVFMKNVASAIPGSSRPTISMNPGSATLLSVRGYHGGLTIKDADNAGDLCTVELDAGSLTFDSSCVLGTLVARGIGKFVDESNGATVIDETLNRESLASNVIIGPESAGVISDAVWNKLLVDMVTAGSAGERMNAVLTVNKYLALQK